MKGKSLNSWVAAAPAKLLLVDLAGSEILGSKPDFPEHYLVEAKIINKSLSTLRLVIAALTTRATSAVHIPYRNSKLTRILEDSLGGTSKLSMIIAVSPAMSDSNETLSSLRFGLRAKIMKNTVVNNRHRVSSSNYGNCNDPNKNIWSAVGRTSSGSSRDSSQNESDTSVYRLNDKIIEISLRREKRLEARQSLTVRFPLCIDTSEKSIGSPETGMLSGSTFGETPEKNIESIKTKKFFESITEDIGDASLTLEGDLVFPSRPSIFEAMGVTLATTEAGGLG